MNNENLELNQEVSKTSELKNIIVNYVGEKLNPKDNSVTLQMIIETLADDFPEVILAVAEENFIRGYQQAANDFYTKSENNENQQTDEASE